MLFSEIQEIRYWAKGVREKFGLGSACGTSLVGFISPDEMFPRMSPMVFSFAASKILPHRVDCLKVEFDEAVLRLYGIDPCEMYGWCRTMSVETAKNPD